MNPNLASALSSHSATLICIDVPVQSTFGIDKKCWYTDKNFKGIKLIPPGIHFIFSSSTDKYGNHSIRTGFFHLFKEKEWLFKKWNPKEEILEDLILSQEEKENYKNDYQSLDKFLGAYPYEILKPWTALTNYINEDVFNRVNPRYISANSDFTPQQFKSTIKIDEDATVSTDSQMQNTSEDYIIKYTDLSNKKCYAYPNECTPSQISQHNMDTSLTLEKYILPTCQKDRSTVVSHDLLGELQYAFICFMYGHHYESFDQWKRIVLLVCSCEAGLKNLAITSFFTGFISVLYYHIQEIPPDFFVDITEDPTQNFLITSLNRFFENITSTDEEILRNNLPISDEWKKLVHRAKNFKHYLKKRGFNFKSARCIPDEMPIIVSLPNHH